MSPPRLNRSFLLLTILMIVIVLYGALYPFQFRAPENGIGPLRAFLRTWNQIPSRSDFVSNIVFYFPLGFFLTRLFNNIAGPFKKVVAAAILGGLIATGTEFAQYYDAGRITQFSDACANTLGTALGAIAALMFQGDFRWSFLRPAIAHPAPVMLLTAWPAYRLYPYVPVADLHKYWDALKPVVLTPQLDGPHLFRQFAVWLAAATLIQQIAGTRRAIWLFPGFATAIFVSEILVVTKFVNLDEILGAGCAFAAFLALSASEPRTRSLIASLVLAVAVIAERLEPFQFVTTSRSFGWIPFYGFMRGSIDINVQSLFDKFYLYGCVVWLLGTAGLRLRLSAGLTALLLLTTSWIQTWLPGRSAEITDAVMVLMIGEIFARMRIDPRPNRGSIQFATPPARSRRPSRSPSSNSA
jgi:VanZ family protein